MKLFQAKENLDLVVCSPDNVIELSKLERFPGLSRLDRYYVIPAKKHLLRNLVPRLKRIFTKVEVSDSVSAIMEDTNKLPYPDHFFFHTEPLPHQRIALERAYEYGNIALLLEPGLGKTKIVLDYIFLVQAKLPLIICPNALTFVWKDEAAIHRPEVKPYVFKSTDYETEFKKMKDGGYNCMVMNYEKVTRLLDCLMDTEIDFLNIDEALIKDPSTNRTKSILKLGRNHSSIKHRMIGSGTLINNSEADMFAPIQFIEPSLVGTNYHAFAQRYLQEQYLKKGTTSIKFFTKEVKRNEELKAELKDTLWAPSVIMTKEEWLDLPPKEVIDVFVEMPEVISQQIEELTAHTSVTLPDGEHIDCDNALVMMTKVAQMSRGFCYVPEETEQSLETAASLEAGSLFDLFSEGPEVRAKTKKKKKATKISHVYVYEKQHPILKETVRLLTEDLKNEKSIVWFNMNTEARMLEAALTKASISFSSIYGGEKHIRDKVHAFNNEDDTQVLLCQAKVINYGVTVLGNTKAEEVEEDEIESLPNFNPRIATEIFFSTNFSLEVYLQQMDRIHRIGQTRPCKYYRMWVRNSWVDDNIRLAIDKKLKINKSMLVDIVQQEQERARNRLGINPVKIEGIE